jgi:hypothetical protein
MIYIQTCYVFVKISNDKMIKLTKISNCSLFHTSKWPGYDFTISSLKNCHGIFKPSIVEWVKFLGCDYLLHKLFNMMKL